MKQFVQIIAMIWVSLGCYSVDATDCFLKISANEYAQYHREPAASHAKLTVGRITPTRVRTYGGADPDFIWNIQAINYTASGVNLIKDYNNNCFIDIYESTANPNKCRIVGINGRNIHLGVHCFSVYEVSQKEGSFVTDEHRLIFLDNSGTYIVSAKKNLVDTVISAYEKDNRFRFKGPVIKISAILGDKSINGRQITSEDFVNNDFFSQTEDASSSKKKSSGIFLLNCSLGTPVCIGSNFGPVTKLFPAMQQIEQITEVQLTSPPPSIKSMMKRISDILGLGVVSDMLTIKDGKVYMVDVTPAALRGEIPGIVWSLADAAWFYSYACPLQSFIPLIDQGVQWANFTQVCLNIDFLVRNGILQEYVFDTSAEAKASRRQIAALMWENI